MQECGLYSDPGLYDILFPDARQATSVLDETRRARLLASERFYLDEAQRGEGRVLELGCGSGRLTIPLAQAGVHLVGADLSEEMLHAARAKASAAGVNVQFECADMRAFTLPGPFETILIPGNSLLHLLTVDDLKRCFVNVRRHLAPGGRLVFDVSHFEVRLLARNPHRRYAVLSVDDPQRGEITVSETAEYDAASQVRHVRWRLSTAAERDFQMIAYRLRVIFPEELLLLLDATGFRLQARYGEFSREPFGSRSPRQLCICGSF